MYIFCNEKSSDGFFNMISKVQNSSRQRGKLQFDLCHLFTFDMTVKVNATLTVHILIT